ncbi:hypothetical protein IQ272_15530, partial [Chroococcidiopsidales cyanobacterium LEGE 13417]|nr:hypothetical protein [Chroococcidiopsidales cyanobacterium LEGE 13417]
GQGRQGGQGRIQNSKFKIQNLHPTPLLHAPLPITYYPLPTTNSPHPTPCPLITGNW